MVEVHFNRRFTVPEVACRKWDKPRQIDCSPRNEVRIFLVWSTMIGTAEWHLVSWSQWNCSEVLLESNVASLSCGFNRHPQIFYKSRGHLRILGVRSVARTKIRTDGQQMLRTNVKNYFPKCFDVRDCASVVYNEMCLHWGVSTMKYYYFDVVTEVWLQ
jgi:hypothetical protein